MLEMMPENEYNGLLEDSERALFAALLEAVRRRDSETALNWAEVLARLGIV